MAVGTRAEAGPWRLTGRLQWSDYEHHGSFGHFSFFSELELSGDFGADVWAERLFASRVGFVVGVSQQRFDVKRTDFNVVPDFPNPTPVPHLIREEQGSATLLAPTIGFAFHLLDRPRSDFYLLPHVGWARWKAESIDIGVPDEGFSFGLRAGYTAWLGEHWGVDGGAAYLHTTHDAPEGTVIGDTSFYTLAAGVSWRF